MEDRFKVNKRKEKLMYLAGFLFSGIINIIFWFSFPSILSESLPEDLPFIYLGGFAAVGSFIALIIHYIMYSNITKDK